MKFKLHLVDKNGNDSKLGLDEVLDGTKEEVIVDYQNFLVANEGFEFGDGNTVAHGGETYEIQCQEI